MAGFEFLETMAGSLRLGRGAARPLVVTLRGRSGPLLRFLQSPAIALDGEVDAEGFADHRRLRGAIDAGRLVRERRLPYAFAFTGNDGLAYAFAGEKALARGALVESFTLLFGRVTGKGGDVVGEALLRFDLQRDLASYLRSFRAGG